jgi:hypothetical protein
MISNPWIYSQSNEFMNEGRAENSKLAMKDNKFQEKFPNKLPNKLPQYTKR